MNSDSEYFIEYFTEAQNKALTERESTIVELRYGLMGGEPHTLEAIGHQIGVSRERIRQILNKSVRKIVSIGKRELKNRKINEPCAELMNYVQNIILPTNEGAIDRLVSFTENELSHLPEKCSLSLIAYLAFQKQKDGLTILDEAQKILQQRKVARWKDNKKKLLSEKFQRLVSAVIWPNKSTLITRENIDDFEKKRSVSTEGKGNAGGFYSSKMRRFVEYESSLEFDFYHWLEQLDEIVFYQEQPLQIPYRIEEKNYLYYPDVLIIFKDYKGLVVEIKPIFQMALQVNLNKWTGLKKYCNEKGLGFLVTDGRNSIQDVQRYEINPRFSQDVLESLQKGPLDWAKYKQIRDKHAATRYDFVALILNFQLVWQSNPFRLSFSSRSKCG